jgi:2-C-methyl-D-erythritol 4-phosphate cytidylyltransferase / 2-C-methyl-D-erythritol 2,4-cyclodiphosphate synthase
MQIAALIMAAGRGTRTGDILPKQYKELEGKTILRWTLRPFLNHPKIASVRVVIHPEDQERYEAAISGLSLGKPITGKDSRQASVLAGLEALAPDAPELVLIHDAARPFVDAGIMDRIIDALQVCDGAIAAIPETDSLKYAENGRILRNVPRDGLWRALTPQGFHFQPILKAHRQTAGMNLTDDAAVAEQAGLRVQLVSSTEENFKITHADDFRRAERLLQRSVRQTRSGIGYDVHRFAPGESVILCGVEIPHDRKLSGHSDADVALHALTDALLGAVARGDIGQHFPPSDPRWKGAPSDVFLRHAGDIVRKMGGEIINLDVTIICETPRIGPHRLAMQQRIEEILELSSGRASVKATTTETLGFTGRGEGIAAQALAVVSVPA